MIAGDREARNFARGKSADAKIGCFSFERRLIIIDRIGGCPIINRDACLFCLLFFFFFLLPSFLLFEKRRRGEMERILGEEERNCITTRQIRRMGKSCKRIQFIRSFSWERNSSTDIFNRSIDKKISVGVIG